MRRIRLVLLPLVVAGLSFGVAACGDDDDDSGDGGRRDLARPCDRRLGPAQRRPGRLRPARREGRRPRDRRDQLRDRGVGRRPHGRDRPRGQLRWRRSAVCRPGGAQDGGVGRGELHRGRMGLGGHDPDRRVGDDPGGGPADLAGVDERRDHRSRRTTASSTGPRRPTRSRVRRWPSTSSIRVSVAPRARRSTSAPATTPTAPAWTTRSARPGRSKAARSARRSSTTSSCRTTTPRPSRSRPATRTGS